MIFVDLEVPAISNYKGTVCTESAPNWSFDSLVSELSSIEEKIRAASPYPSELKLGKLASPPRPSPPPPLPLPSASHEPEEKLGRHADGARKGESFSGKKPFVMRAPDDEDEDEDGSDSSENESSNTESEDSSRQARGATGTRFSCTDLYLSASDSSGDESEIETSTMLMRKTSIEEGLLLELERENQLRVKEEVRKRVSRLEAEMRNKYEKSAAAILQIEKRAEAKQEMDRRLDRQYQRKIAEELEYHLSIVQRNHAQRSQAEELRIRNDAAAEEAKRKEKALQEEKSRQEKAKAEAEARLQAARKAEEAHKAALEAEKRSLKEVAERDTSKITNVTTNIAQQQDPMAQNRTIREEVNKESQKHHQLEKERNANLSPTGIKVKAAASAINAAESRLQKYNEMGQQNVQFLNYKKEIDNCERQINKKLRQITGTVANVRAKANDLINIIRDPQYPHSVSIMTFAKKVISLCENPSGSFEGTAFACGHVILLVASQIPAVMDIVLGEFHSVCIYTVPKHMQASEPAARIKDYWKLVGYREENGKMETSERFLERVEAYMKLYGALVQTEMPGIQNPHGLKEGWAWLARFLNELPATAATATALHAFLKMSGFTLFRKYKSQFKKILNVISYDFLPALKMQQAPILGPIISRLEVYISKEEFLKEPEGWRLRENLLSRDLF